MWARDDEQSADICVRASVAPPHGQLSEKSRAFWAAGIGLMGDWAAIFYATALR